MATEFRLPDIGEGLIEAEIIEWSVPVGGTIGLDEVLVEVETDKASVELPSPIAGTVLHHGAEPGAVLAVGEILAVIGDEGEVWSPSVAPIVGTLSEEIEQLPAREKVPDEISRDRSEALPKVRRLAAQMGIELDTVSGTGPRGRITEDDLVKLARPPETSQVPASPLVGGRRVPLGVRRRTIASRMTASWTTIPHVTAFDDANAAALLERRAKLTAQLHRPVPIDALLLGAVAAGLVEVPEMNATFDGDDIVFHDELNVGVAMDAPEGLTVPVVPDVASLSLTETIDLLDALAYGAAHRSLTSDQLSGATFTMSNIGAVGGGYGTPIVPLGTAGILSFGRAKDRPVAMHGALGIAPVMPLSLSYDHRQIDGALGRKFLQVVIDHLERLT